MKTCGLFYKEALNYWTNGDPDLVRMFAAGFIHGQAEKVYLGACSAAMFRPSGRYMDMVIDLANHAAGIYGLHTYRRSDEVWIYRETVEGLVLMADKDDHALRAYLCGIPASEVDLLFHERDGFGEPCDLPR